MDEGDGFYRDGSFVQHGCVAYTGSYGLSMLIAVSETIALLHGSPWAITDPGRRVVLGAVERSFAPFVHDGRLMDTVRGRAGTRQAFSDEVAGHAATGAVLLPAECAREPYRSRFRALAKGCRRDIDTGDDTAGAFEPVTRRYVRIWLDHGTDHEDASYAYVLLPNAARSAPKRPSARVLANTGELQAVRPGVRPVIRVALGGPLGRGHAAGLTTYARRSPRDDR
ncbi:polysaccharide lyase family 8 super-sandwich domain-containing protein [Nonomuraea sp. NPDC049421]|uniref:polysaccharide lyase family 8 super-sandwich domain-containing protein n=1 Tax=Nonomuraea sp. NPDC049421 TaxID=3155275 RepID=UPI003416C333